jgi:hypothetical protein
MTATHTHSSELTIADAAAPDTPQESIRALSRYLVLGTLFGIVLTKAQVISWFRIQEMFRFQSFHNSSTRLVRYQAIQSAHVSWAADLGSCEGDW